MESSHDLLPPRVIRSASEPGAPSPSIRQFRSFRRPATSNDSPSVPSFDSHSRTPSELSIFPYTPFLDPAGTTPRAPKTTRSLERKEPSRPATSPSQHTRATRSHTVGDRPTAEEIERRAISKYRDLERGRFGEEATMTIGRSRQDSRNPAVSSPRKPSSAQRSGVTPLLI
jgi:hypothetical protein